MKPWEPQKGESLKAYEAWVEYRDMSDEDRSLREVARRLKKSLTIIGRWSGRWGWVERLIAYKTAMSTSLRRSPEQTT